MLDTANKSNLDALRKRFDSIVGDVPPASELSLAARQMLSAMDYNDKILVESSLNSLLEALRKVAQDVIRSELRRRDATTNALREVWRNHADGVPCENVDELKKMIESFIDDQIVSMVSIRDGLVKTLEEREHPVDNAQELKDGILALQEWKENIIRDWPSSSKEPAPLNQQAVNEAREAIARGEKGLRREDLKWGKRLE